MDHRVTHLDARGVAVEQDAANLLLQQRRQLAELGEIRRLADDRRGQLAVQAVQRRSELGLVGDFHELDTGKKRTDGSVKSLKAAGIPDDHILYAALKTLDVPGSMDATNSALVKLPGGAKNLIIGGMNDNTVLGGVRATESAGFAAANVIGIGINGTDAIGELKKANSGFFGSMLPSPHIEGYNTASMMFEWVTTGKEPPKYTAMDEVTLITRENFKQELEKIGLWN